MQSDFPEYELNECRPYSGRMTNFRFCFQFPLFGVWDGKQKGVQGTVQGIK